MTSTSTLRCDRCGLEITEEGIQAVEPPDGWAETLDEDFCPPCADAIEAEETAQPAEQRADAP